MPSPLVARKRSSALVQDDDNRKFAPFTVSGKIVQLLTVIVLTGYSHDSRYC